MNVKVVLRTNSHLLWASVDCSCLQKDLTFQLFVLQIHTYVINMLLVIVTPSDQINESLTSFVVDQYHRCADDHGQHHPQDGEPQDVLQPRPEFG